MNKVKSIPSRDYLSFKKFGVALFLFCATCAVNIVYIFNEFFNIQDEFNITPVIGALMAMECLRLIIYFVLLFLPFDKSYSSLKILRALTLIEFLLFTTEGFIAAGYYGVRGGTNVIMLFWFLYFMFSRRINVYFNGGKYIESPDVEDTPAIINGMVVPDDVTTKSETVTNPSEQVTDTPVVHVKINPLCTSCGAPIDTINLVCTGCGKKYVRRKKVPPLGNETTR